MSSHIELADFRQACLTMLEEIFEKVHRYTLDPNTSLFETLANVSAKEASRPISANCACIAAQVNHIRFYIDALSEFARTGVPKLTDWPASWRVGPVTEEEWQSLISGLRSSYADVQTFVNTQEAWPPEVIGGAFALVAHCAYHLGEIRQGLGVLRDSFDSLP